MDVSAQDYQSLLTDIIKKEIAILGPAITLAKVRQVKGLSVSDDGTVTSVSGNSRDINKQLIDLFSELSRPIVKKTMGALMTGPDYVAPPSEDDEEIPTEKAEESEPEEKEETPVEEEKQQEEKAPEHV